MRRYASFCMVQEGIGFSKWGQKINILFLGTCTSTYQCVSAKLSQSNITLHLGLYFVV